MSARDWGATIVAAALLVGAAFYGVLRLYA